MLRDIVADVLCRGGRGGDEEVVGEEGGIIKLLSREKFIKDYNYSRLIKKGFFMRYNFSNLLEVADTLLGDRGCPWDKKQTLQSLQKYLQEEAKELIDAIDQNDSLAIAEEAGDLLYIIIFIVKVAEMQKLFTMDDVTSGIYQKLIRRHPHIFHKKEELDAEEVAKRWKEIKKQEKKHAEDNPMT